MSPDEFQDKKQTLVEVITSFLTEELDEAVAYEMSSEIENFATEAVSCFVKDGYGEDSEGDGMVEYHADMDTFSSLEE